MCSPAGPAGHVRMRTGVWGMAGYSSHSSSIDYTLFPRVARLALCYILFARQSSVVGVDHNFGGGYSRASRPCLLYPVCSHPDEDAQSGLF